MIFVNNIFQQGLPLSLVNSTFIEFRVGLSANSSILVDWGDNSVTSYSGTFSTISHAYSSPYTGVIKISCSDGNFLISSFDIFNQLSTASSIAFTTEELRAFEGLTLFSCQHLSNIISGDIIDLPQTLEHIFITGYNTLNGDISNISSNTTLFKVLGNNTLAGDIGDLKEGLLDFVCRGSNTISGNIDDLPSSLLNFYLFGLNTTSGDIANLPSGLISYTNNGSNTTFGDIMSLPSTLTEFQNLGNNTVSGSVASLPLNMKSFNITGFNTIAGSISSGSSGTLPNTLEIFAIQGNNTVSGDISGTLPPSLIIFILTGVNTVTGDIGQLPSLLERFSIDGDNTTFGSISDLPPLIRFYANSSTNEVNNYTLGRTWYSPMTQVISIGGVSGFLSSQEVDDLLIDLANVASWVNISSSTKVITLTGNNQPRTSASDSAVATLIGHGVIVTTN